jgi:type II secretory pathway pseudopilin PulG
MRGARALAASRRGVVLLEVVVALTILATAGAAMIALSSQSIDSLHRARAAERETERASEFLDAVALWPRSDLDRHLGDRPQGPWRLVVERPLPTLFTIALTDSTGSRTLVTTALYRAEVNRVAH